MKKENMELLSIINEQVYKDIQRGVTTILSVLTNQSFQRFFRREALKKASLLKKSRIVASNVFKIIVERDINILKKGLYLDSDIIMELQNIQKRAIMLKFATYNPKDFHFSCLSFIKEFQKEKSENSYLKLRDRGYIAILVNSLDVGGLEQVVAHLARGIKQKGIALEIWCLYSGGQIADVLSTEGFCIRYFNGKHKLLYKYAKENVPVLINSHYIQLDLVQFKKMGIPVIEVIHNMYVVQGRKFLKHEKKKYHNCCKIIAVSELSRQTYIKKLQLKECDDKIIVIGNSAQERLMGEVNRNEVRTNIKINAEGFVFINVASIDSRKNQLSLIDAFDIVCSLVEKKPYLILIGNILEKEYYEKLRERISKCLYQNNIRLLPYDKDIQKYYQISDSFIMNSFYEGWSIAATEALYSGLPLIHSECGSAKELTRDGRYGIMISNPLPNINEMNSEEILQCMSNGMYFNLEELTKSMLVMYYSQNELRACRENISNSAKNEFNRDKMIAQYMSLFEEVCVDPRI